MQTDNYSCESFSSVHTYYYLGIDGGGTKTTFKLVSSDGSLNRKLILGASNPNDIGMKNTTALLKRGIDEICNGLSYSDIVLHAGLSGGGSSANKNELKQFFGQFGFMCYDNSSDIDNMSALITHHDYILVIMGTGFVVCSVNGSLKKQIGGWGWFFDNGGSGYSIGRDAITAALCAVDGSGSPTVLNALFKDRIGESVEQHLKSFYNGGKRYIASFADLVFEAVKSNDKVAENIIKNNMKYVSDRIAVAAKEFDDRQIPVYIAGGLSNRKDILFPLLQQNLSNTALIALEEEPVDGAINKAMDLFNTKVQK